MKRKVYCSSQNSSNTYKTEQIIWEKNSEGVDYSYYVGCEEEIYRSEIFKIINNSDMLKGRILDAGCGLGTWLLAFRKLGLEVHGMDFARGLLKRFKGVNNKESVICGDLRVLPFEDSVFDTIVSWGVVEHLPEGPAAALKEFRRCLKAKGWLAVSVPLLSINRLLNPMVYIKRAKSSPVLNSFRRLINKPEQKFFEYEFRPEELSLAIEAAGLKIVAKYPIWLEFGISSDFGVLSGVVRRLLASRMRRRLNSNIRWAFCAHMLFLCRK